MASDTLLEVDEAKKVVEFYHPQNPWKGLAVLWKSGHVTVCWKKGDEPEHCCYTTKEPAEELFYPIQAFYTSESPNMGFRIRELHREV